MSAMNRSRDTITVEIREPLIRSHMAAATALRDGMQGSLRSEPQKGGVGSNGEACRFTIGSDPRCGSVGRFPQSAGFAGNVSAPTWPFPIMRSLTPQTARKALSLKGCVKNERSRRCTPWLRRITTTCVVRLANISFLTATRFMADLIRGSLRSLLY